MRDGCKRILAPMVKQVFTAENGRKGLALFESRKIGLVVCDIKMPQMDGLEVLTWLKAHDPSVLVIMVTGFSKVETAIEAMKKGAYDFISKPFDHEELIFKIQKALERSLLVTENKRLAQGRDESSNLLIGKSRAMDSVFEKIDLVAASDVTVLITGESGTGKDLTARSIHGQSRRKDKSFIPVNCPTIPEHILESELFGYKKGAFTNAHQDKKGLFQEADGGTIFLDEIGDIGPSIQTKLLRVIQEKEIKPLGDNKVHKVDVRIIASTNQDLAKKIEEKEFREDLYYRLSVIPIELPPLRDRREDIPLLADHLVTKHCRKMEKSPKIISEEVMALLKDHPWKGNVRELENVLVQGILYAREETIQQAHIPIDGARNPKSDCSCIRSHDIMGLPYKAAKEAVLTRFNHDYVGALLSLTGGNITQAAKKCGLDRQALQQIMKRFAINPDDFR
ncbi:MAG: sigma-54 dependent transcriptional regulator [Desulfobacterales bacterium]|nr:sigma-54 dependent transcriptional regulator [Desulfobacterales bacterium]